jgi:cytochrome c553
LILVSLFSILLLSSCSQPVEQKREVVEPKPKNGRESIVKKLQEEYESIDSIPYLESYIQRVIKDGSSGLGFKSGNMQGGFADEDSAKKIAHFVVELSGKSCSDHKMAQKAQMYYTSNCGGCHGDDGKGLNGAYPDLTRDELLGITKRKEFLRQEIEKLLKR